MSIHLHPQDTWGPGLITAADLALPSRFPGAGTEGRYDETKETGMKVGDKVDTGLFGTHPITRMMTPERPYDEEFWCPKCGHRRPTANTSHSHYAAAAGFQVIENECTWHHEMIHITCPGCGHESTMDVADSELEYVDVSTHGQEPGTQWQVVSPGYPVEGLPPGTTHVAGSTIHPRDMNANTSRPRTDEIVVPLDGDTALDVIVAAGKAVEMLGNDVGPTELVLRPSFDAHDYLAQARAEARASKSSPAPHPDCDLCTEQGRQPTKPAADVVVAAQPPVHTTPTTDEDVPPPTYNVI